MNWSPAPVELVPAVVVTVMSTVAAAWAGETAVMDVLELTTQLTAGTLPKFTAVVPVRSVPVMVTEVPPAVLPLLVPSEVTVGAEAAVKVNWSLLLEAE